MNEPPAFFFLTILSKFRPKKTLAETLKELVFQARYPFKDWGNVPFPFCAPLCGRSNIGENDYQKNRIHHTHRAYYLHVTDILNLPGWQVIECQRELLLLDAWLLQFPRLSAVYWRKEEFFEIYSAQTEEEAWTRYLAWHDRVAESGCYDAFLSFFLTMETWGEFVFNYFREPYTGGFVEAANGIGRLVTRAGRGYSFTVLRARLLYGQHLRQKKRRHHPDVLEDASDPSVDSRFSESLSSTLS